MVSPLLSLFTVCTILTACMAFTDNITEALKGSSVILFCKISFDSQTDSDLISVKWRRVESSRKICEYLVQNETIILNSCDNRIVVKWTPHQIEIKDIETKDTGQYSCTVSRQIPPPVEEKEYTMNLSVQAPPVMKLDIVNISYNRSEQCISLVCLLESFRPRGINITWTRKGEWISEGVTFNDSVLSNDGSFSAASYLTFCAPNLEEEGLISCLVNHTASPVILNKTITVPPKKDNKCCNQNWIIIVVPCVLMSAGILVASGLCYHFGKCRTLRITCSNQPTVYTNEVYENLSFGTLVTQTERTSQDESSSKCIYEN
ncbi:uncharacterized protein LOC136746749 isoform X2 [Amia ocellicauda]|uniref:uncharacterized protein LOC136746749 isoform X2 n=1 Tax=Amia ocellicauda TaxID=2972642 RepID=UPI003464728F